jgi:hypothetical protein
MPQHTEGAVAACEHLTKGLQTICHMYMYMHMYVCMYICIYMHIVSICLHMCLRMHACVYAHNHSSTVLLAVSKHHHEVGHYQQDHVSCHYGQLGP